MPQKKKTNKADRLAVVDIGSNSVRLVVFKLTRTTPKAVFDKKATCRLALGLQHENPRLNPNGVKQTLKTLKNFQKLIEKKKITETVAIGTAAMRAVMHTREGKAFHQKAEKALGQKIRVIDGREEARLTAQGLTSFMPDAKGVCGDLGGGSLELASFRRDRVLHTATVDLGTLTLLGETGGDPIVTEMAIRKRLRKAAWLQKRAGQDFYAIGGSWRGVGRIMMQGKGKSGRQVHGFTVKAAIARKAAAAIAVQKPSAFRLMHPKIRKRADIIPVAAATLVELIDIIRPARVIFSGHGIREGIVRKQSGR